MRATAQTNAQIARDLIPLVHEVASRVARRLPSHVGLDDLIGSGMLGLAGALIRYDAARSETFKGYAEFRIRGAIIDDLRRRDLMSRDARIESKRMHKEIDALTAELGRVPDDDEIASRLGVDLETYRGMQLRLRGPRVHSGEAIDVVDEEKSAVEAIDAHELRAQLVAGIEALPERQRLVLWLYYYEELPLRAIAEMLSVTASRVCQIRGEAVELLRQQVHGEARLAA